MKVSNKLPGSPSPMQGPTAKGELGAAGKIDGADALLEPKKVRSAADLDSAKVELSSRSQEMRKAKELATPSDGIDEAKVARLQKLIDDGNYKIDADAIADRMLDEHMKMPM